MFYQRENMRSSKDFAPCIKTNLQKNVAAYFDLHYTSVNIICRYSFCIFFVRCFLNTTLIKNKGNCELGF